MGKLRQLHRELTLDRAAGTGLSRRFSARLAVVSALLLQSACVTSVITPELETRAGNSMSQQVADQIGLYMDPELERYLDMVGQRLVDALEDTPYQFQFALVDQAEPNAFASPGGFIYVSRGLMAQINDEAELAGVLAHEISHVTRRHHVRQAGRSLGAGLLTLPGRAVGVVSSDLGQMINAPIEHAGKLYLSSYSRAQESEADAYGMRLASAAGYEPLALADALEGIENSLFLLTGEHHQATYLDTHPTTPRRVAEIDRLARELHTVPAQALADRKLLYRYLDGLWWGPQNPQQGIFRDNLFLSADLGLAVSFPAGWQTVNTPRFVGAMEPDGEAYLALGLNPGEFSPDTYATALINRMRDRTGLQPVASRDFRIGQWPAHLVRYDDDGEAGLVSLYYVFLNSGSHSFTFMAMGREPHRQSLQTSVMGIAPLSSAQAATIGGLRLRIASINAGESLTDWSRRVGSSWSPAFTAAVNGLEETAPVTAQRELKYVRRERYASGQ
ncbi:M48 family metalloprotease [Seongchinamella sediminis]|nr:M48 family metalloprotease [Seongchinamella sediminis]